MTTALATSGRSIRDLVADEVQDGLSGYLFDHTISHALHNLVTSDIDAKFGMAADGTSHKILNQAMYDVAHTLGDKSVKLASFH